MTTKKVSYIQLLKEAISEYDAKALDYKGPITEPILTFDGEGELSTHRDASSILERYYFKEEAKELVECECGPDSPVEASDDEDAEDPNEIVTGEEADDVDETMEDLEDEILDEELELEDYEPGDEDIVAKDEPLEDEKAAPMNNESEILSLENMVIEKLIQEMEAEEKEETAGSPGVSGEEAGTDLESEKEVEKMVEDIDLLEMELEEADEEIGDEEKEEKPEDLDVDEEVGKEKKVVPEGKGMGPIRVKAARELEEAFNIFKEQIEDEEKKDDEEKKEEDVEDAEKKLEDVEDAEKKLEEELALFEDDEL